MYPVTRSLLASRCFLCVIMFSVLLLLWSYTWKGFTVIFGGMMCIYYLTEKLYSGLTVTRFVAAASVCSVPPVAIMGLCRSSLVPSRVNVLSICPWSRSKTIETNLDMDLCEKIYQSVSGCLVSQCWNNDLFFSSCGCLWPLGVCQRISAEMRVC